MPDLWQVARTILLLSHGQATVERGFSVNKETMADNMLHLDSETSHQRPFDVHWWEGE